MRAIRAGVFLFAALLAGCGDDDGPTKPPTPTGSIYLIPSTPQNVLENLRRAYEARDSVATDSVYHPDYQGQSMDMNDPGALPLAFTKVQEVSHVGSLRKDSQVTSIVVNFGLYTSWPREGSLDVGHPEWASITISQGIRVEITTAATTYTVGTNDFMEYQFAPTTPAPSSPTDTLWTVVRWREIKGAGG